MTELQTIKWKTTPVDFDPFAGEKPGYKLTPVDFDPFKEEPRAPPDVGLGTYQRETMGPSWLERAQNVYGIEDWQKRLEFGQDIAGSFIGATRSIPGYKGSPPVFNPEVEQLLRTRRAEGVSANKIAQEIGVSHTAVNKWMKQLDMEPSSVGQAPVLDPELVYQRYHELHDTKAIAHEFGVSRQAVEALVRKMDLVPKERGTPSMPRLRFMERDPFADEPAPGSLGDLAK